MMPWMRRTLAFTRFSLQEYIRSGRILIEIIAMMIAVWLFFWPRGSVGAPTSKFFNLGGLFLLGLTIYTTASIMGLGNRPQGYVLLARRLGRRGYIMGLYLAALLVVLLVYLVLSLLFVGLGAGSGTLTMGLKSWVMGSVPLLLNVALLAAFMTLISPLVLSSGLRLLVLGFLAVALSTDVQKIGQFQIGTFLKPIQSLLALPLLPPMNAFELAIQQSYDRAAIGTLLGQLALTAALIAFALSAFDRRELILSA
jgi:hypothetical protein